MCNYYELFKYLSRREGKKKKIGIAVHEAISLMLIKYL